MIKQIAWNTFKNTGNIKTMLELLEVERQMESININEQKNALLDETILRNKNGNYGKI